jgi:RNA polymerase sigma-70 factor (ECF subfamily)
MEEQAFERLYARYARPLLGFFILRTGDRALAEDLVADTFEKALRRRHQFDRQKGSEATWLYAIALNRLRDHGRRRAAEHRAVARSYSPPEETEVEQLAVKVERHLTIADGFRALSSEERESLALRFGADLTVPQIAQITGEPLTTIESRVYRALRKLRELVG